MSGERRRRCSAFFEVGRRRDDELTAAAVETVPETVVFSYGGQFWLEDGFMLEQLGRERGAAIAALAELLNRERGLAACGRCEAGEYSYASLTESRLARCRSCGMWVVVPDHEPGDPRRLRLV